VFRAAHAAIATVHDARLSSAIQPCQRPKRANVRRAVVNDDHVRHAEGLALHRLNRFDDKLALIEGCHDHSDVGHA
jgi:hypothetical protein